MTPDAACQFLFTLDDGNSYRAVATGDYRPQVATEDERWARARDAAMVILAANVNSPQAASKHPDSGRNCLCQYLYWLAHDAPNDVHPSAALDSATIARFVANEGVIRRRSHRSRVALASAVRAFRFGYPVLFPPARIVNRGEPEPELPPVEDWQFALAWEETQAFRHSATRQNARAVLLLGRGAGLAAPAMAHVAGHHIAHEPGAGTWVQVVAPGQQRRVPVLERYGALLEDLAEGRPERCLIASVPSPCDHGQPGTLMTQLSGNLQRHGHNFTVNVEGLRKAWLIEHVAANVPIRTLLQAAGLTSLRTMERLVPHMPAPPDSPVHLAYELGAVPSERRARR